MANGTIAVSQLEILTQSGTGIITVVPPTTNTNRTLTLPDSTTTLVGTDATQTLTNKTLSTGLVMGASTITSGTAVASTSGTSIDFTSIPSWVKRITVMFNGVSISSSSAEIYVQIGSGSVETTGYLGTSGSSDGVNLGGANFTTAFGVRVRNAAQLSSGTLVLTLIASNTWIANGMVGGNSNINTTWSNGSKTTSGILDRLRITTSTGTDTFDAGSINILYE